jgi:hypothetical protein
MCFSPQMSGLFSILGLLVAYWVYSQTRNVDMTMGVVYFVLMEALQYVQYQFINDCKDPTNQFLTVVGFAHICFQPYFTHLMNFAVVEKPEKVAVAMAIKKLCLIQGVYMFSRWLFVDLENLDLGCAAHDWVSGDSTCTYMGNVHLAWKLPLRTHSYFWPCNNIHFFMMFAPFLVMGWQMAVPGVILFLTGPYLSTFFTNNLHEQASIWSACRVCVCVCVCVLTETFSALGASFLLLKSPFWSCMCESMARKKTVAVHGLLPNNGRKQDRTRQWRKNRLNSLIGMSFGKCGKKMR